MRKFTNILAGLTGISVLVVSIFMMVNTSTENLATLGIFLLVASVLCVIFSSLGFFIKKRVFSLLSALSVVVMFVLIFVVRLYLLEIDSFFVANFFGSEFPISSLITFILFVVSIAVISIQLRFNSSFKDGSRILYNVYQNLVAASQKTFRSPFLLKRNVQFPAAVSVIVSIFILVFISYNLGLSSSYTTLLSVDDKAIFIEGTSAFSKDFNLSKSRSYLLNDSGENLLYYVEGQKVFDQVPEAGTSGRLATFTVDKVFETKSLYIFNLVALFLVLASILLTVVSFFIPKKRVLVPLLIINFVQFLYWVPLKFGIGFPVVTFHLGFLIFILFFINLKSIFKSDFANFVVKILFFIFVLILFAFDVGFGSMIETGINWMQAGSNGAFLSESIKSMVQGFASVLKSVSWLFIALIISFLLVIVKKDLVQGIFIFFTLFLIEYMGIWSEAMDTMSLVVFSTFFALLLGIPQGILAAFSKGFNSFITPVLDFMQTMPAFVYLIPAVAFFGLGEGPAVFATLIFAIPPCIRLTALGIKQINPEFVEAADSFGSTKLQKLIKIQIPNALPTIMAGINQTIMLSLSMVVIASMVGTGGLGKIVFQAVNQLQLGNGFEGGIAVVIVAIILDKITQSIKH